MSDSFFNSLLTHNCKIYRRTFSTAKDKWGASAETLTTVSSSEDCLFQQTEELIEFTVRGEKLYTRLQVFMKPTANIREDDILEFEGKNYRVVSVDDAAGQGHHYEVGVVNQENPS